MEIVFIIIRLFGGLALFLYGMRLMGDNLKEGSSGTLKNVMLKVTDNPIKAFFVGLLLTAIIQSSTATIVITSGLVAAQVLTLRQSLGIIVGANVGTTVTGQIIRLLDINEGSASSSAGAAVLRFFKPDTLAPIALIAAILLIMFLKLKKSNLIGGILMGFGILFTGLLNMTAAVESLTESGGFIDKLFQSVGDNIWLGYLIGAGVAFILQSSSATIGILQAFAMGSVIPFKAAYIILVGVYLGDCVTTAIVCSIGAQPDSKRVGLVNILFNIGKTILCIGVVTILHTTGVLGSLWEARMTSGTIANVNSIFNLASAIVLLPFMTILEKLSLKMVKDKPEDEMTGMYEEKMKALNPVFFSTPAIAFNSCYEVLKCMFNAAVSNINKALDLIKDYSPAKFDEIKKEEKNIDMMTDKTENYLVQFSPHVKEELHTKILDQYNKLVIEFERLGDHAENIGEAARDINASGIKFTEDAYYELSVVRELLDKIFDYTRLAFEKRDVEAAKHIEPLEEVIDDLISALHDNHLQRLRDGSCTTDAGTEFLEILSNIERISDICSNIGISVISRVSEDAATLAHAYVTTLHQGNDAEFDKEYHAAHDEYFGKITLLK